MTIFVIFNPYAGRQRSAKLKDRLTRALASAGLSFELAETTHSGHGIALAQTACQTGYETLVAAGGDGTINEVVNGMALAAETDDTARQLGLIPLGSGNDFAAMVGYDGKLEKAVAILAQGQTRTCDIGKVTLLSQGQQQTRYFNNNLGVGFEARVNIKSQQIERLSGIWLYLVATLQALRSHHTPQVRLRWETATGEQHERSQAILLITVGNSARTGGGFYLTPHAQIDDGLLDLGIADAISRPRVLQLLPKVIFGKHIGDPAFTLTHARHISITSQDELPVQMDGELVTADADSVEITLLPAHLNIIVGRAHA